MGGMTEIESREALYRQLARQPGLPAGLRPELIRRAEECVGQSFISMPSFSMPPDNIEGCKGAIGR